MKENNLLEDLFRAYYDARKNKRNTINQLRFEMDLQHNLYNLYQVIQKREYVPGRSIAFIVEKPVKREVFAADFKDRVVHHLLFNYVNPIFERTFIDDSYSCRKGRGTHYGIKRLRHHILSCSNNYTRPCFVLKLDLQGYFMNINRSILFDKVTRILQRYASRKDSDNVRWKDKLDFDLILYLAEILIFHDPVENYHMNGSKSDWYGLPLGKSLFNSPENCGLPIGNLTSQLFSNVYLNSFDHYVKRDLKVKHYGRYVDDFYMVHEDKNVLLKLIPEIRAYLKSKLGITLHPKKIYLQKYDKGVLFVGAFIKPYRTYVSNRTKENFSKSLTELKQGKEHDKRHLSRSINSYLGIMCHYKAYNIRRKIMMRQAWVFNYGYVMDCCTLYKLNDVDTLVPDKIVNE